MIPSSYIAFNIDYSCGEVNRRLVELKRRGFLRRVERGKYQLTAFGRQYLAGPVTDDFRSQLHYLWTVTFDN